MAIIVDRKNGTVINTETGEVIEDHVIDEGMDWRAYGMDEFNRKAHACPVDPSFHDFGLHTFIEIDPPNKFRDIVKRHTAIRLLRANDRIRIDNSDRRVVSLLQLLHSYADLLGLPKEVVDDAAMILRRAVNTMPANLYFNRRNRNEYIVALLVISAKRMGIPLSIAEAVKALQERGSMISRFLVEDAAWKILRTGLVGSTAVDPRSYIPKFVDRLGLKQDVATLASAIISLLKESGLHEGRKPSSLAGAAVYVAAKILGYEITQKQVSKATGENEVTLRNSTWFILERVNIEVQM